MSTPSNKARAVFVQAVELESPADRAALLARECAGDPGLRARVEGLLRAFADAGSFLEHPAAGLPDTGQIGLAATETAAPGGAEAGTLVAGRYRLLAPIGEGGMGTVWLAEQTEPVKRTVAVKLIKPGMDSKLVVTRFEAERQALALMDHPNIAKVLDGGVTAEGRPFFAMELVQGVPITQFCDDHRLTPRARLELFLPVCQAVQHAHQKGVIHRDLKPNNVLVALYDDRPVPKVIDFGVAKATGVQLTEETLHTGFGAVVGTVEYMSPEQATFNQLDIDTRSDVYSLGVLLYELLAGSPPFSKRELERAGVLEMLRVIREQEPSKPSTKLSTAEGLPTLAANRGIEPARLTRLVKGELDWIVLKALEKDRNRRYETASGFATDVQRYLADEPVQACPPSAGYRLRKFVRRNQGPVLAATLVALALIGGVIGTTWGMLRATNAEADAKHQAGEKSKALGEREAALATATANEVQAKAAQRDAQENLKDALAAVDQMLTRVGNDRLAYVPQMEAIRRELLQDAVTFYQRFLERNGDDPLIRRETAMAYRHLAGLLRVLGQLPASEVAFRKAFALFDQLEAPSALGPDARTEFVNAHLEFAAILWAQAKREEHAHHLRRAVQIAEGLAKEFPAVPQYGDTLVQANLYLAQLCPPDEREKILRRNLLLAKQPWSLALVHLELSGMLGAQGRYPEAEQTAREAARLWEQGVAQEPSASWLQGYLGNTLCDLADWVAANGRLQEAADIHGRAVTILDKLAADYPGMHEYRDPQAWAHHRHAGVLKELGRTADAEKEYRRAVDLFEKLAADFPTISGSRQTAFDQRLGLGQFLVEIGRAREAIQVYGEAVERAAKPPTELPSRLNHWQGLVRTHIELGRMLTAAGKHQEAQAAFREALAIRDRLEKEFADKAEFRRDLAAGHLNIALALKEARRIDNAIETYRMALSHAREWVEAEPKARDARALLADVHLHLATIFRWDAGETLAAVEESEKAAREALARYDELAAEFPKELGFGRDAAECVFLLATGEFRREQFRKAEGLCRLAIARYQKLRDWPDHLRTDHDLAYAEARDGQSHLYLARTLGHLGRSEEAAESFGRAVSFMKRAFRDRTIASSFAWERCHCHMQFGLFLAESARPDEAEKQFHQVLELSDTVTARNELAWGLAAHADPRVHNGSAALAVKLAKEAVDRAPNDGMIVNTLGAALYRAGQWKDAIAALNKAMDLRKGGDSFDWFFLAMAHWQLGEKDKAREFYDRAAQWMDNNRPKNEELRRFRAEAAELLELNEKK